MLEIFAINPHKFGKQEEELLNIGKIIILNILILDYFSKNIFRAPEFRNAFENNKYKNN